MAVDPFTGQTKIDPRLGLAQMLLNQGMSQAPIHHWLEGFGRMAQTGVGAYLGQKVQAEEEAKAAEGRQLQRDLYARLRPGQPADSAVAGLASTMTSAPADPSVAFAPPEALAGLDWAKNLEGVDPQLVNLVSAMYGNSTDIPFMVTDGARTVEEQQRYFDAGKSQTMDSRHIPPPGGMASALDIVPLDANGQPTWNWDYYGPLAEEAKAEAARLGIPVEWGGDWTSFPDGPHWQLPRGAAQNATNVQAGAVAPAQAAAPAVVSPQNERIYQMIDVLMASDETMPQAWDLFKTVLVAGTQAPARDIQTIIQGDQQVQGYFDANGAFVEVGRGARWQPQEAPDLPGSYQEYLQTVPPGQATPEGYGQFVMNKGRPLNVPTSPAGYATIQRPDGSWVQEIIPGGPADLERQATEVQQANAAEQETLQNDVVTQTIDRAIAKVQGADFPITGLGSLLSTVPGTGANDLSSLLDTIKANVGFGQLLAMRQASPTGAALGPVSDNENRLLQATLGSLAQSQSSEQLLENLNRLYNVSMDFVHGVGAGPPRRQIGAAPEAQAAPQGASPDLASLTPDVIAQMPAANIFALAEHGDLLTVEQMDAVTARVAALRAGGQ